MEIGRICLSKPLSCKACPGISLLSTIFISKIGPQKYIASLLDVSLFDDVEVSARGRTLCTYWQHWSDGNRRPTFAPKANVRRDFFVLRVRPPRMGVLCFSGAKNEGWGLPRSSAPKHLHGSWVAHSSASKIEEFPDMPCMKRVYKDNLGVGTLVSNQERRALVVSRIKTRVNRGLCSSIGLHRISFVRASRDTPRGFLRCSGG